MLEDSKDLSLFEVTIGSDYFKMWAKDNQEARYLAAELFKTKYFLVTTLTPIASHAHTRLVKEPVETSGSILVELRKESIHESLPA